MEMGCPNANFKSVWFLHISFNICASMTVAQSYLAESKLPRNNQFSSLMSHMRMSTSSLQLLLIFMPPPPLGEHVNSASPNHLWLCSLSPPTGHTISSQWTNQWPWCSHQTAFAQTSENGCRSHTALCVWACLNLVWLLSKIWSRRCRPGWPYWAYFMLLYKCILVTKDYAFYL